MFSYLQRIFIDHSEESYTFRRWKVSFINAAAPTDYHHHINYLGQNRLVSYFVEIQVLVFF